jgi:hypothetical protein
MKDLLTSAMHEILQLRRQNEILAAKVEVMDLFACVLNSEPARRSQGMAVDVAWVLQKQIDELTKEEARNAHQGHSGGGTREGRADGDGS